MSQVPLLPVRCMWSGFVRTSLKIAMRIDSLTLHWLLSVIPLEGSKIAITLMGDHYVLSGALATREGEF